MTPFWHLTTLSCLPMANPEARLKEQKIFRQAASDAALRADVQSQGLIRSRWAVEGARGPIEKSRRAPLPAQR
jgi:hypothetical protein